MKHQEYDLQKAVCNYLNLQYPEVLYISTGTSLKLTKNQAVRNKAIQKNIFKCPDLLIFKRRYGSQGLFIELKIEDPLRKNGNFKSEHIKAQYETICELNKLGYHACFAVGFDEAKRIIDGYLTSSNDVF